MDRLNLMLYTSLARAAVDSVPHIGLRVWGSGGGGLCRLRSFADYSAPCWPRAALVGKESARDQRSDSLLTEVCRHHASILKAISCQFRKLRLGNFCSCPANQLLPHAHHFL